MFGGGCLGSTALGGLTPDPGAITDPTSLRPILTELNHQAERFWARRR